MVISDFLDKRGYQEALRYLLARNMDIYVIHVLSQEEIDPSSSATSAWSTAKTTRSPRSR